MRRFVSLLLVLLLLLVGCADPVEDQQPPQSGHPTSPDSLALLGDGVIRDRQGTEITLERLGQDIGLYTIGQVQYWRKTLPGMRYGEPRSVLLQSNDALQAFAADNALTDGYAHYTDAFFVDHDLLLVGLEVPSGSIRYGVDALTREGGGELLLEITQLHPYHTEDMADWQLAIPVKKGEVQPDDMLCLRENEEPIGRRANTVEGALCLSSPLNGLYDEPLSRPFVLWGRELARFATWYGVSDAYAALIGSTDDTDALLIVPVRTEFHKTAFSLTCTYDANETALTVTVRESRDESSARIDEQAYHLVVPLQLSGDALPSVNLTYERQDVPLPDATPMQQLHVGSWQALLSEPARNLCLRSTDDLSLLLRISGITPPVTVNGFYFGGGEVSLDRGTLTDVRVTDIYAAYDEDFFAAHDLLLLPHTAGSGSNRHEVKAVTATEDGVCVTYACIYPGFGMDGTCDIANWTFLVPMEKGALPENGRIDTDYTSVSRSGDVRIEGQ